MTGEVLFVFTSEDTFIEKDIRVFGINGGDMPSLTFIPMQTDDHDLDDYIVEELRINVKAIKKDLITVVCSAPNGATGTYKYKYSLTWE